MRVSERDLQIIAEYQSGMTLQEVGDKHNLTRERVRQLLYQQGVPSRKRGPKTNNTPKLHTHTCQHCTETFNSKYKNKQYCSKTCHTMGMRNKIRKFSDDQLANIRKLYYDDELTGKQIAEIYGVHFTAIYHILSGRTYTDHK